MHDVLRVVRDMFGNNVIGVFVKRVAPDQASQVSSFVEETAAHRYQGGLLTGVDPTQYDPADPLRMFVSR